MSTGTEFDYYYGEESNQFSYYRIPRQLVTGERFKRLSTDAKLLYGLLLDRMGLSAKNGWYDEAGRVYIYYTLEEIQKDLSCGHEKAVKLLAELDKGKGIGLIERKKQGQGRPAKIYVKRFTTRAVPPAPPAPDPDPQPRFPIFGNTDFRKPEVQTSENPKSRLPKTGSADFGKTDGSYIKSTCVLNYFQQHCTISRLEQQFEKQAQALPAKDQKRFRETMKTSITALRIAANTGQDQSAPQRQAPIQAESPALAHPPEMDTSQRPRPSVRVQLRQIKEGQSSKPVLRKSRNDPQR